MAYVKKAWKDRNVQYPLRRYVTNAHDGTDVKDVYITRNEGNVIEAGDLVNAANLNDLEDRIEAAFGKELTGTLAAGSTSITFSDEAILTTSTIDFYTDVYGVNPTAVTVATGSVTLTFDAQQAALGVKVVIT